MFCRERINFALEVVALPHQFHADGFEMLDVLRRGEFGGGVLALFVVGAVSVVLNL
jgi:hypothetical protein